MPNGIDVYIWEGIHCEGGDLAAIHAKAKAYGVDELWKGSDGGRWYQSNPGPLSTIVKSARDAGVGVSVWDYLYLSNPGATFYGYSVAGWSEEQNRITDTMVACPPDRYYLNNEAEAEGQWQRAQSIASALRQRFASYPGFVSACLPVMRFHPASPYKQWSDAGFLQAPELYWSMFRGSVGTAAGAQLVYRGPGVEWTLHEQTARRLIGAGQPLSDPKVLVDYWDADCAQYGIDTTPFIPTYMDAVLGGAQYACSNAEIIAFLAALVPANVERVALWDWQHMDHATWERTKLVSEWIKLQNPAHRVQALIDQAKVLYTSGNTAYAQANTLLGQALTALEAA